MTKKRKTIALLPLLATFGILASCASPRAASSSVPASSEAPESSEASSSEAGDVITIELSSSSMSIGLTFNEGCSPTVYVNGAETEIGSLSKAWVEKDGTKWGLDEPLTEAGDYLFKVRTASLYLGSESFSVVDGGAVAASEGNGYDTVSSEDALKYAVHNVPYAGALGPYKTPSTGDVKIVVIPVVFSGGPAWTDDELSAVNSAFFGEDGTTGWMSLASYYKESSYGALNFSGTVLDVYQSSITESEAQTKFEDDIDVPGSIANAAIESARSGGLDLSGYDSDSDGYLDAVELIYKSKSTYASTDCDLWWNWTTYTSNDPDTSSPVTRRYVWASLSQMLNGYYGDLPDAHTIVHETGHMMGLDDYYDYDGTCLPMGGADMMEYNIGDHDAYSKYLLGWVTPKAVDGTLDDFTVTLNDFESTGDCLIVRDMSEDPWNGTPYDEYLIMSYYTPTGLNELDMSYPEWSGYGTGGMYRYRGLQVLHVDERLIARVQSTGSDSSYTYRYTDDVLATASLDSSGGTFLTDYAQQATSNTKTYSEEVSSDGTRKTGSDYKEVSIIPASGDSSLFEGTAGRKRLGSLDALMGISPYAQNNGYSSAKMGGCFVNDGSFNDGTSLGYSFFVSGQTDETITIRFVRA